MKHYPILTTFAAGLLVAAACSDDDPTPTPSAGAAGMSAGSGGTTQEAGSGGMGGTETAGTGGTTAAGSGGMAGMMNVAGMMNMDEPDASVGDAGVEDDAGAVDDAGSEEADSGAGGAGGTGGAGGVQDAGGTTGGGAAGAAGDEDVDGPLPASLGDCPTINPSIGGTGGPFALADLRFTPGGSAIVVFANVSGLVQNIGTELFVCNGLGNCNDLGNDLTDFGDVGRDFQNNGHFTVEIPNTVAAGGEIAVFSSDPNTTPAEPPDGGLREFPLYYVQWGTGAGADSLAQRVEDEGTEFWLDAGDFLVIDGGDSGFVGTGVANSSAGYTSCNHGVTE